MSSTDACGNPGVLEQAQGTGLPADPSRGKDILPAVTIIVPTYQRAEMLRDTLDSLIAQRYPPDRLEIIVVDNSSMDHTEQVVQEARQRCPFPLLFFRKENRGPAASRNYGLARAKGEIVGFTDSDCRPDPDWVRAAARCFEPGVGVVSGSINPYSNPLRPPGAFYHQISPIDRENAAYPTANLFFRKAVLDEVGCFDDQFGVTTWGTLVGGEDTELAWRVKRAGYRSAFARDALVSHEATAIPLRRWIAEPARTQIVPYLVSLFPELRRELLWHRYFVYPYSAAWYFSIAGVLVGTLTPFRPALAAPLLLVYMMRGLVYNDIRHPRRWWKMPIKYGLECYKLTVCVASLWYGSIRARTIVV